MGVFDTLGGLAQRANYALNPEIVLAEKESQSRIATNKARQSQYEAAERRYDRAPVADAAKQPSLADLQAFKDMYGDDPELGPLIDQAIRVSLGGTPRAKPTSPTPAPIQGPTTPAPAPAQPATPSPVFSGLRSTQTPTPIARRPANQAFVNPGVKLLPQPALPPEGDPGQVTTNREVLDYGGADALRNAAGVGAAPSIPPGPAAEPEPLTQGAFEDTVRKMGNTVEARTYYDLWKNKQWQSPLLKN